MIDKTHDLPVADRRRNSASAGAASITCRAQCRPAISSRCAAGRMLRIRLEIDELHLDYPFAGSRMLQCLLKAEGLTIDRLHVATLMKRMGIEAIYCRPSTTKPAPGHKIYPYLLRNLPIVRSN